MSDDNSNNKTRQDEELEAISSIYADEFFVIEPDNRLYLIRISSDQGNAATKKTIGVQFKFPSGYPSTMPLEYEIQAPWLRGPAFDHLNQELWELVTTSVDSPIVHTVVETVRTFLQQHEAEQSAWKQAAAMEEMEMYIEHIPEQWMEDCLLDHISPKAHELDTVHQDKIQGTKGRLWKAGNAMPPYGTLW
ncbi:unnamed protein product [Echinostoma caproni]|uniref:RWD domain-containing protein n=1 Tax=Echinostoma caproni TaxID=27848 RepID=A0A183B2L2_9TREM|nr:unnamed protein product [Echinostoma caproni]